MAYGEIKVDTITFTDGGIDKSVSISGLVQNPTFSGDITVTGTISGDTLQGQTVSGVTVTGTTAQFTSGTFISLTGTTTQGTTSTYTTGSFTSLTGTTTQGTTSTYTTGSFTSLTGTTTTGTTASFATGVFTSITGITATITSGIFASGTAAAPSVSVGTTDNGLYSPGADEVAISTNGTGRLFVDASGKVGVGTAATASLVTANGKLTLSGAEDNQLEWSLGGQVWRTNMASGGSWYLYDSTNTRFPLTVEKNPISNITIAASSLQFLMTGTERMRLDSSGRLGLGTSSPSQLLHVNGGTNGGIRVEGTGFSAGANIQILNTSNSNTTPSFIGQRTTATPTRGIEISDGTNPYFYVDTSNGRVGIGTSSPQENFDLAAGGDGNANGPTFALWRDSASPAIADKIGTIHFDGEDSAGARVTYKSVYGQIKSTTSGSTTGELVIGADDTGAGAQVVIDSLGNVGIGTTSPSAALHVATTGTPQLRLEDLDTANAYSNISSSNGNFAIQADPQNVSGSTRIAFETDGSERARIDSSGRLLVGTSSASGNAKLQVAGDITATGDATVGSVNGGPLAGVRNLLINGNPIINQRGYASGTATSGANQYTLDRWRVVTSGEAITWTDSANVRTVTAPAGGVEQVIEGLNILSGTYTLSWTGTATATVDGSSVTNGGQVTLTGGTNATVRFSGGTFSLAQLEVGTVATPFERRSYGQELALCQRYYYRPNISYVEQGYSTATNAAIYTQIFFPVAMRVTPTLVAGWSAGTNAAASTISALGIYGAEARLINSSPGDFAATINWTSFSAEL